MSHTVRAARLFGPFALAGLLAVGACTTEFVTEGGSCQVDGDCETGEVCRGISGLADGGGQSIGVCLRACTEDRDCVTVREEICRLDPDGVSGVCGRECAVDSDCPGARICRFDQCIDPMPVAEPEPQPDPEPDLGSSDAAPRDDGATDATVDALPGDALPGDALPGDQAVDAAPLDLAVDALPLDGSADMQSADMAGDALPVGADALPDMAPAEPMQ